MTFKKVKGFVDYYPEENKLKETISENFKQVAKSYGFEQVDVPAIESMDLLCAKSGDEIKTQLFTIEKKSNEDLGLRFDLTVPITRMFIEKQKSVQKPVKWFSIDRMWRYEAPQKGRLREFYQLSVECYGAKGPMADAEVINLAIDCLKSLGLTSKDFKVKVNNRKLIQGLITGIVKPKQFDQVLRVIDKKSKITKKAFEEELDFLKRDQITAISDVLELSFDDIASQDLNELAKEGYENLKTVMSLVDTKYIEFDSATVRGLAYYTGTVFEIFDTNGEFRALAGGGRYDELVELFKGESCPATGFGIGFATLSLLLQSKKSIVKERETDYYIAPISKDVYEKAYAIAKKLRKKYTVQIDLMGKNLSKQIKDATSRNTKELIIVGKNDLENNQVTIRNLKTGKERKEKTAKL